MHKSWRKTAGKKRNDAKPLEKRLVSPLMLLLPPDWWGQDYPRIQILTIDDLLHGRNQVKMPPQFGTFKQAQRVQQSQAAQQLEFG